MKNENESNHENEQKNNHETKRKPGTWPIEKRKIVLPGWEEDDKKIIEDQYNIIRINVINKVCLIYIEDKISERHAVISLTKLESMLDPELFFHANKAENMNMYFGKSYRRKGRSIIAKLKDNKTIDIARRRVPDFLAMVKNFPEFLPEEDAI